jgi:hypothetical protein
MSRKLDTNSRIPWEDYMEKKISFPPSLILIIVSVLLLSRCDSRKNNDNTSSALLLLSSSSHPAGASLSFTMAYVTGKTDPTGSSDTGTATIPNAYWIGETSGIDFCLVRTQ